MLEKEEVKPISQIYYFATPTAGGGMARLWSDGWHCTCHRPDCEHIRLARTEYEAEQKSKRSS